MIHTTPEIHEVPADALELYATIPMRVEVQSVLEVTAPRGGLGGLVLTQTPLQEPYTKDYDEDGDRPTSWPETFDVSRWGFFLAVEGGALLGGAAVAFNTNGVNMLESRSDLGVLWDIRVQPSAQGRGIGRALFEHAASWLRERECRLMKIETQNVNVGACAFYQACGCTLGAVNRYAYLGSEVEHEVMLLWYLSLER